MAIRLFGPRCYCQITPISPRFRHIPRPRHGLHSASSSLSSRLWNWGSGDLRATLEGPQKWLLIDYRADVYILLPIFSRRPLLVGRQRSNNHLSALVHQGGLLLLPLMQ